MSENKRVNDEDVLMVYQQHRVENHEVKRKIVHGPGSVHRSLLVGHILGGLIYLLLIFADFRGAAGYCWQGSDSAGVCKLSREVQISLVCTFILWAPLLGSLYLWAFTRRHELWSRVNLLLAGLVSMLLTAAVSILLIPSPGSHPNNDGSREFEAIQNELKLR